MPSVAASIGAMDEDGDASPYAVRRRHQAYRAEHSAPCDEPYRLKLKGKIMMRVNAGQTLLKVGATSILAWLALYAPIGFAAENVSFPGLRADDQAGIRSSGPQHAQCCAAQGPR